MVITESIVKVTILQKQVIISIPYGRKLGNLKITIKTK